MQFPKLMILSILLTISLLTEHNLSFYSNTQWVHIYFNYLGSISKNGVISFILKSSPMMSARSSLTFRQLQSGFTLKRVHDMTRTCRQHVTFKKFSRRLQVCWGGSLAEGRGDAKEKIKTNENFFAHKKFFLSVIIAISSCL